MRRLHDRWLRRKHDSLEVGFCWWSWYMTSTLRSVECWGGVLFDSESL